MAAKEVDKAGNAVKHKVDDLAEAKVKTEYNVAAAKADGLRKIALERCNSQGGEAQRQCKRQAEAEFDASTARAIAARGARSQ